MVKYVAFEESFRDRCIRVPYFSYGIILGGSLKEEECLFLPIETPIRNFNESDSAPVISAPKCIADIDEKWVSKHCKSILRMVPGGVRISGLFVTATSEEVEKHETHINKILAEIVSADKIAFKELITKNQSEKIILFADPNTKCLACKAIDVDGNKGLLSNVEIRIKPILSLFKAVKTCVTLNMSAYLPTDRKKERILRCLEDASEPFLHTLLSKTDILICGAKRDDNDFLFESVPPEGYKSTRPALRLKQALIDTSSDASSDYWSNLIFTFYGPDYNFMFRAGSTSSSESGASSDTGFTGSSNSLHQFDRAYSSSRYRDFSGQRSASGSSPIKGISHQRNGFRSADEEVSDLYSLNDQPISIQGVIPGIAFLPIKTTTVMDVKQAFREDLVRSTLARLELLSDQLHISSGEFENPRMYLPQRVLVRLPACKVLPLSDYKFCSETQDEVVERLIWLSLPLGSHSISDSQASLLQCGSNQAGKKRASTTSLDSEYSQVMDQSSAAVDSGNDSIAEEPEIAIDASCVDFGLETVPTANEPQVISDRQLLQEIDQSIKHVAKHSRTAIVTGTLLVLLISIILGYFSTVYSSG